MQISEELFNTWKQSIIEKSAVRLLELEGVDISIDEAEAFATALIQTYDELLKDKAVKV